MNRPKEFKPCTVIRCDPRSVTFVVKGSDRERTLSRWEIQNGEAYEEGDEGVTIVLIKETT